MLFLNKIFSGGSKLQSDIDKIEEENAVLKE